MTEADAVLETLAGGRRVRQRVTIVVAHPDDETIGLGAQLCRFDDALLVHVTEGAPRDGGDAAAYGFTSVADYAAARQTELANALRAGEAESMRTLKFGMPDKEASRDLVRLMHRLAALLDREHPAAVFTHAYEGGHPDHDAAAFAVHAACHMVDDPPLIIEMPFYHRESGRFVTSRFLPSRLPEWEIVLTADDSARKQRMVNCFLTQRWLLRQFDLGCERFRVAPDYDFTEPPHSGELHYETLGWGIAGREWRRAAARALAQLRLVEPQLSSRRRPGSTDPPVERQKRASQPPPGRQFAEQ